MERERSLNPFARHDASDGEFLTSTTTTSGDDNSVENLNTLFIPFENSLVHINRVTNFEYQRFFAEILIFDLLNEWLNHGYFQFSEASGLAVDSRSLEFSLEAGGSDPH
jgi:hypothetical protein